MKLDMIFLAGGIGSRLKLNYPKQFHLIGDKPLMIYSLEVFEQIPEINNIYVATLSPLTEVYKTIFEKYKISKAICVEGGATRHLSVYNCLKYINSEKTLIHVSSRPFITVDYIKKLLSYTGKAIIPVIDVPYIIYDIVNKEYPPRENIKYIQLPQVFQTELLKAAHNYARTSDSTNFSDDSNLVLSYLKANNINTNEIKLVPGLRENFKITYPYDLHLTELLLNKDIN